MELYLEIEYNAYRIIYYIPHITLEKQCQKMGEQRYYIGVKF